MLLLRKEWIQLLHLTHSNDSVALWKEAWAHGGCTFQRITCKIHTVTSLQTTVRYFYRGRGSSGRKKTSTRIGFRHTFHTRCIWTNDTCLLSSFAKSKWKHHLQRWKATLIFTHFTSLLCCSQTCSRLWSRYLMIKVLSFGFCKFYMMEKPWGSLSSSSVFSILAGQRWNTFFNSSVSKCFRFEF